MAVVATLLVGVLAAPLCGCMSWHTGPMAGEPDKAAWKKVHGVRVRYVDEGAGSPVVLVHGFASSLDTWGGLRRKLRGKHRVIALDLKGFGWTDRPAGDYSPQAQAKLVFALLDDLGVRGPVAVVGHSWGSSVALAMALQRAERVARLVLMDAWVFEEQLPAFFLWARTAGLGEVLFSLFYDQRPLDRMVLAFHDPLHVSQPLADAVHKALRRPGTKRAALAAVRGQRYLPLQARYPEVRQPTLLLWGAQDVVSPVRYGRRLAALLPDAELRVYPRCGHFPTIEARPRAEADVARFLAAGSAR